MAEIIKCNTKTLGGDRDSIRKSLADINKSIENLKNIASKMDKMWDGDASEVFKQRVKLEIAELDSICDALSKIANFENNSVTEYDKCNQKIAGIIESINI